MWGKSKACSGNESAIASKDTTSEGTNLTKLKTLTDLHFFFRSKVFLISTMSLRGHAMTGKREKNVIFPPEPLLQWAGLTNLQEGFLVEGKGDRSYGRHLSQNFPLRIW